MFEVELSRVDPFRTLVKALSVIVEEGTFVINEANMRLLAMDPSHVAMVDFELPNEFFDIYKCENEPRLSINIKEFLKFLDRVNRDELVRISLDEDKARLLIRCSRSGHNRRFEMPILDPLEEEIPQPKIFFKSKARIVTQSLRMAIQDANLVSEHVKIEIMDNILRISADGDIGSARSEWTKESAEIIEINKEEDSTATFTLSYLQDIVGTATSVSEVAMLELSTDMPIKMDFEISQGRLVYYLAPCIGV